MFGLNKKRRGKRSSFAIDDAWLDEYKVYLDNKEIYKAMDEMGLLGDNISSLVFSSEECIIILELVLSGKRIDL